MLYTVTHFNCSIITLNYMQYISLHGARPAVSYVILLLELHNYVLTYESQIHHIPTLHGNGSRISSVSRNTNSTTHKGKVSQSYNHSVREKFFPISPLDSVLIFLLPVALDQLPHILRSLININISTNDKRY